MARLLMLSDNRRTAAWQQQNPQRWARLMEISRAARRDDRDAVGAASQLSGRAGHDTWARLPELDLPVLIAAGRYDDIAPVVNQQAMHRQIRGSELMMFDGGHLFFVQDRGAWPKVIDWLKAHE